MRLEITLPSKISATWNYNKRFSYGIKFAVNGSQYSVDGETSSGIPVNQVRFSRVTLGPELGYRLKGPLVFSLYGGMAVGRTYDFELEGGDGVDFSLDNGPFVSFKLSFRPQIGTQ